MTMVTEPKSPARRPRNRKALILAAAARRFRAYGYHEVAMGDIAADVGVTAGALYRHFRGKEELLTQTIANGIDAFGQAVKTATDLGDLTGALATLTLDHRDLPVLWQRETRCLPPEQQHWVRQRMRENTAAIAGMLRAERPELSEAEADTLTWAALAVLTSPAHHRAALSPGRFATVLSDLAKAVLRSPLPAAPARPEPAGPGLTRASRREALLTAATRLFAERGFHAVTMEDIGAAAAIAGPSVYKHFGGKNEILAAALNRGTQVLDYGMDVALATAAGPRHALELLLNSYAAMAAANSDLVTVLITEVNRLPATQRHEIRRAQHDYVDEWARLLTADSPALDPTEALVKVHAALSIPNDLFRTPHLRGRPGIEDHVRTLGLAVLLHPSRPA